jgi:hypothetical protein
MRRIEANVDRWYDNDDDDDGCCHVGATGAVYEIGVPPMRRHRGGRANIIALRIGATVQ